MNGFTYSTCWDNSQLLLSTLGLEGLNEDFLDALLIGDLDSNSNLDEIIGSSSFDTSSVLIHDPFMGFLGNEAEDLEEDIIWI